MLTLTDAQLVHLHRLANPVEPARRAEFLAAVTLELEAAGVVSEGNLHRVAARLQRAYWTPPEFSTEVRAARHLARA